MTIELVIFDMDGVIFEGRNFWLDLHRSYSTEEEALELADRYLQSDYQMLSRITTETLWKDKPFATFLDLVAARVYQKGAVQLFAELREDGVKTAIVSSGPRQLAARAQQDLGINEIRANELELLDGRVSGVRIGVSDSDKGRASREVMSSLAITPDRTAAVGDSGSDVASALVVGLPIAYDSRSARLDAVARVHLKKGELVKIASILRRYRPDG